MDAGAVHRGTDLQGLCTSLMLIAAVPPLVVGWPATKMPWTGATMNMCVFGAVALGPVIGGIRRAPEHGSRCFGPLPAWAPWPCCSRF